MLSILIPTFNYNTFPLVENLWNKIIVEKIPFEILVLDDGSTSFLIENEQINSLENCNFIKNSNNLGRTQTRNLLAKSAKYDWLLFLDSDVIPVNLNFISEYIHYLKKEYDVILGGIKYEKNHQDNSKILRYKYGKSREEIAAKIRNKNPYSAILSGNILIKKNIFLLCNFTNHENLYGMDNYFAYQLFLHKFSVYHIENTVYHIGLEDNEIFLEKSLLSVYNRKQLFEKIEGFETLNPILKKYKIINYWHLNILVSYIFKKSKRFLKKNILGNNPNLLIFDLYRLGYLCSLKKKTS